MKSEKRKVSVCRKAARILKSQQTRAALPLRGGNSLASPVSWVTMPEPRFPSTAPTQADSPPYFPEKQKHPRFTGGAPAGSSSLASPVSQVSMPEPLFPSTVSTQADSPPHFPEKQKHPGFSRVFVFMIPHSRVYKRKGSPLSLCANCVQAQPG